MSLSKEVIKKNLQNAPVKNMIRGAIFALIYLITALIIPFSTFTWVHNLEIEGVDIGISQYRYEQIIFWIVAFGLLICGTAFFAYSAPSKSIRRGAFSLFQVLLNCFYLWSYKFSGALEVEFELIDMGIFTVNLTQMILLYMGIYFLTVIIKTYDLIDFIYNRDRIKFERGKK